MLSAVKKFRSNNITVCTLIIVIYVFTVFIQNPFPPYKNYTHDKNCIFSDGFGYYSYLPAVFIYHDLSFSFFNYGYEKNYNGTPPPWARGFIIETETGVVNKYWIGESLLLLPFFLIAHWLSLLLGYPADGYSQLYQYSVFCASFFYLYLGCRFIYKYLTFFFQLNKTVSSITIFTLVFGTNLFYYSMYEPSMSHVYSFFCISGFCYYGTKYFKVNSFKPLLIAAFFFTMVVMVRPVNAICITFLPFLAGNKQDLVTGLKKIQEFGKKSFIVLLALLFFVLQMVIWKIQCGKWFIWSYPGEEFNFTDPHYFDILFSYRKGFFVYMPVFFVSLIGLIFLFKTKRFIFYSLIVSLLFIIYILSSWYAWDYSACFGNRAFIDYYFVFAVFIAASYQVIRNRIFFWSLTVIYIILIFFNHIQLYQYRHDIYHSIEMTKEKYWKVFLKTEKRYEGVFYDWGYYADTTRLSELNKTSFFSSFADFENAPEFWQHPYREKQKFALSGEHVGVVSDWVTQSNVFVIPSEKIKSKRNIVVESTLFSYLGNDLSVAYVVHQLKRDQQIVSRNMYKISDQNSSVKEWKQVSYLSDLPLLKRGDTLSIYLINAGSGGQFYDNFKLTLYSY